MALSAGPYFEVPIAPGHAAPFYALRYDKSGRSAGPLTQQHLLAALAGGDFTDVYLFSHGWNNNWATALGHYRDFISRFREIREKYDLRFERPYRPLLAGVFWPSTALVMPWERGPDFAGEPDGAIDDVDASLVSEFAAGVAPEDIGCFYELSEKDVVGEGEAEQLLHMLSAVFAGGDPDLEGDPERDVEEMLAAWAKLEASIVEPVLAESASDFGAVGDGELTEPEAAGLVGGLMPRNLLRLLTVQQMKDRAGLVGAAGVGPLLASMQSSSPDPELRIHLIGHSYGARLLLTAVGRAAGESLPRPVESLLLLQPAVNHLCFADELPGGRAGGLRSVLELVKQPILSSFSAHDFPLTRTFHLALRRGKDLGEVEIAADEPPSDYAALGGYGPRGFGGWKAVAIKDPTDAYDLGDAGPEVWAVDGSRTIAGHGDVINESTAWALFSLARA